MARVSLTMALTIVDDTLNSFRLVQNHEAAGLICNAGRDSAITPLSVLACSVAVTSSIALVAVSDPVVFSASRSDFRFCFFAPIGNRLQAPQAQHFNTKTAAHGLRPPLLKFSVDRRQFSPSMSGELHILQMACLRSRESRICAFCATERRCAFSCKGRPESGGLKVTVLRRPGDGFLLAIE